MYRMNCALMAFAYCFVFTSQGFAQTIGYELNSSTFVVEGTPGEDVMEFVAGMNQHVLIKNGLQQMIDAQAYSTIRFEDGNSDDIFKIDDSVRSDGVFKCWHDKAEWTNSGQCVKAIGFGAVEAKSVSGKNDRAYLYGTLLNDELNGSIHQMLFTRSDGTEVSIARFDRIYPTAYDGWDSLNLSDSADRDNATSKDAYFKIDSPDVYFKGFDFEKTIFNSLEGGDDRAYVYDSSGSDLLVLSEDRCRFIGGTRDCSFVSVDRSYAYSQNGGVDHVKIYDNIFDSDFSFPSAFTDAGSKNGLEVTSSFLRFFGSVFYRRAEGFVCTDILEVNPKYLVGTTNSNGAVDVNIDWDQGVSNEYFIEQQRYGCELVIAGLGTANQSMIDFGVQVLQWGIDQQGVDGSFPGTGDSIHSTSLFMHALAKSIRALERFGYDSPNVPYSEWQQSLEGMALWLVNNDDESMAVDLVPYTHRYFLRASGLKMASDICQNTTLSSEADSYFDSGVILQTADGILPELGGFDVSYQLLGIRYATEFVRYYGTNIQESDLNFTLTNSFDWIDVRIDGDGNVDVSDSTRANELGRNGQPKNFDYQNGIRACLGGHEFTGVASWSEIGVALFQFDSSQ